MNQLRTATWFALLCVLVGLAPAAEPPAPARILPADWDAKAAGDRVLAGLVKVTAPEVKGAHDAEMAIVKKDATRKVAQGDMQFSMHQALQGGCPASRVTIFWSSREDKIAGRAPVRPTRIPAKKRRPLEWR